jgi:glutaredoxin
METVNKLINNFENIIFSKDNCFQCKKAIEKFETNNINYKKINIPKDLDDEELFDIVDHLKTFNNQYPFIFMNTNFINFNDLDKCLTFKNNIDINDI